MKVPFLDLKSHHEPLREELREAIDAVIDRNAFAGGPFVETFEAAFARFCESEHAVGVGSGTEALWLALLALGVGPGDEVITVPMTFIATAEAISYCGARPVFVDIDERTYTMDPARIEAAITPRTKAIIPVHLYGQTAHMDPILEIGRRHGIPVVEDAAQAHGAEYKGRKAGSLGAAGCFSFYPGKNLGAFGEAGAVVTNDADLSARVAMLRDHGQGRKHQHQVIGWNARMDGIQAAVLSVKLAHLDAANARRRASAEAYDRLLVGAEGVIKPVAREDSSHVYHLYVVRVRERDQVLADMADRGIACGIHYPTPVHRQAAYDGLGYPPGSFSASERCSREVLSLPMYPELTEPAIEAVVSALDECLGVNRKQHEPVGAN